MLLERCARWPYFPHLGMGNVSSNGVPHIPIRSEVLWEPRQPLFLPDWLALHILVGAVHFYYKGFLGNSSGCSCMVVVWIPSFADWTSLVSYISMFSMCRSTLFTTRNTAWLSSAPHPESLGCQIRFCPCNPTANNIGIFTPSPFLLWYRVQTSIGLRTC